MPSIIKLQTSDGKVFDVDLEVACFSSTIKTMLDDLGYVEGEDQEPIPISNVSSTIMEKVITWATHHKEHPEPQRSDDDFEDKCFVPEWDKEFLTMEYFTLTELTRAANFLDIKGLLDVCTSTIANMIKGKNPVEIREILHIRNDFLDKREQ